MTPGVIRLRGAVGGTVICGVADAPGAPVRVVVDHLAPTPAETGVVHPWDSVRLLAPLRPRTVVAFAKNYADHAAEMGGVAPAEPVFFLKPPASVIGPGDAIELPASSALVHHEAELAVVIGATARDLPPEHAARAVVGYTCANDVSARDFQARDGQWGRAKGFDTFCPLGPWIAELHGLADLPPAATVDVSCTVNGELRQHGATADLLYSVAELIAFTSAVFTLEPGDVILTGTPAGVGPLAAGDEVAVTIGGIGTLTNGVRRRD